MDDDKLISNDYGLLDFDPPIPFRVAVVGSRTFKDAEKLTDVLYRIQPDIIVSGGAAGAYTLAQNYAKANGIPTIIHRPDWNKHGRWVGFVRNTLIVQDADMVVAFWDGASHGTMDTINKARQAGKKVLIEYF